MIRQTLGRMSWLRFARRRLLKWSVKLILQVQGNQKFLKAGEISTSTTFDLVILQPEHGSYMLDKRLAKSYAHFHLA